MEYALLALILAVAGAYAGIRLYRNIRHGGCGCDDCSACGSVRRPGGQDGKDCCCGHSSADPLDKK